MVADKDIIVAIELGSSAIRGIAGQKGPDGNMKILAVEQENVKECVRRGVIFNIDKTTRAIRLIKDRLEEKLDIVIKRAYVGLSGLSLHSVPNKIVHDLGEYIKITASHVDALMDENLNTQYPKRAILESVPQEYVVDGNRTNEPEGIQASQIEGNFLNIIAFNTLKANIVKCLTEAGLEQADILISPLELAAHLLPDSEKRSGCVLVDMGAETTTVAIYSDNILRHLVVIPLGGKNVTKDICSICQVAFEEGETLKKTQAVAYAKPSQDDDDKRVVSISGDRTFSAAELQAIVNARVEEIIKNVWEQVCMSPWRDKLLSGLILTGGAATHTQMTDAIRTITECDKVKTARPLMETAIAAPGVAANDDITLNTLIALLLSGTMGCAQEKAEPEPEPVVVPAPKEEPQKPQEPTRKPVKPAAPVDEEGEGEGDGSKRRNKKKKPSFLERLKQVGDALVNTDEDE